VVYFTTLSVVQGIYCPIITQLINNVLQRIWNEATVDKFEVLSWDLPGRYEENHEISVIIAVVPVKIRNEHAPNT
jgi:hypothetical protein